MAGVFAESCCVEIRRGRVASVPSRCSVRLNIDSERKTPDAEAACCKSRVCSDVFKPVPSKSRGVGVSFKRFPSVRDAKALTVGFRVKKIISSSGLDVLVRRI